MVRVRIVVLVVMALMLAACSSSQTVPPTTQNGVGVVTGFAEACPVLSKPATTELKVGLYSGPTLVASETIRSGNTYRFSVAPGPYRVTVRFRSKDIAVDAGRKVTADIVACITVHGGSNTTVGYLTGFADACVALQIAPPDVKVLLYSGPSVASETVRSGADYRFAAAPGRYRVKVQQRGFQPNGQPYAPKGVVVRVGRSVTADFPSYCKSLPPVATGTRITEQQALTEAGWTGQAGQTVVGSLMTYGRAHATDPALAASDIIDPSTRVWLVTVYLAHPKTVPADDGYGPPGGPQGTEKLSAWSVVINASTGVETDWCMGCTALPFIGRLRS
jgi:hypothetical protein